jgi:hypothetical protein
MKALRAAGLGIEVVSLLTFTCALVFSGVLIVQKIEEGKNRVRLQKWMKPENKQIADAMMFTRLKSAIQSIETPIQSVKLDQALFASELRVVAIGSAYPIPYDAEICPFSQTPQPATNQLDRDADGITDDWELKFGLNKNNDSDAKADLDGDGFTNLEEFRAESDPQNPTLHPPYATKLRFVEKKEVPFPLVFQGVTRLSDGSRIFQLNSSSDGMTHFAALGESVKGVVIQEFMPSKEGIPARLVVVRGSSEIELVRGEVSADPESQAELINILDRSPIIVTMGALLSLRNDEYTVLGVYPDKVVIRQLGTGKVFDIISLAEGER